MTVLSGEYNTTRSSQRLILPLFWILALLILIVCLGAIYYATTQVKNIQSAAEVLEASKVFYREQLSDIEKDVAQGRISAVDAIAAKSELAREVIKLEKETSDVAREDKSKYLAVFALPFIFVVSLGGYAFLGSPNMNAQPFASRPPVAEQEAALLLRAVEDIKAQLLVTPDDVQAWTALSVYYMRTQQFAEAENAYRNILRLATPTADLYTDLAETLIMQADDAIDAEATQFLREAAQLDPIHVRSRLYLAGELTRTAQFEEAIQVWKQTIAISETKSEPWFALAESGLAAAELGFAQSNPNSDNPKNDEDSKDTVLSTVEETPAQSGAGDAIERPSLQDDDMVRGMVDRLYNRLQESDGTLAEWQRMVRSRLVLDGPERAVEDLELGLSKINPNDREALAEFAKELGLVARE